MSVPGERGQFCTPAPAGPGAGLYAGKDKEDEMGKKDLKEDEVRSLVMKTIDLYLEYSFKKEFSEAEARLAAATDIMAAMGRDQEKVPKTGAEEEGVDAPPRSNVYVVDFRLHITSGEGENPILSYRSDLAFIASSIEKAVEWCRMHLDYSPHYVEKKWDFAIRKRELDSDLVGGGLVMILDWNGEVTGWTV